MLLFFWRHMSILCFSLLVGNKAINRQVRCWCFFVAKTESKQKIIQDLHLIHPLQETAGNIAVLVLPQASNHNLHYSDFVTAVIIKWYSTSTTVSFALLYWVASKNNNLSYFQPPVLPYCSKKRRGGQLKINFVEWEFYAWQPTIQI